MVRARVLLHVLRAIPSMHYSQYKTVISKSISIKLMDSYQNVIDLHHKISTISTISSVLYWDTNTVLPSQAVSYRSEQVNFLSQLSNKLYLQIAEILPKINENDLDEIQRRNIEILKDECNVRSVIPSELLAELSKQSNTTLQVWKKAKQKRDFSIVKHELNTLFDLNMKYAELLQDALQASSPFDALIQRRERGTDSKTISKLFAETRDFLKPLIQKVMTAQQDSPYIKPEIVKPVPRELQQKMVEQVAEFYHYDVGKHGAIGEVEHPLTFRMGPMDARVSVKYHEEDFTKALFAAHHELGHAIDSLGSNPDWFGQPISYRRYPSIGECNSRFTENKIGKNLRTWETQFDKLNDLLKLNTDLQTFYHTMLRVQPSTSRIGSDELTYAMHIIIRYELEQEVFAGKTSIDELPQLWNERYTSYLGVTPKDDTEGVMQDLHWYSHYWAYFQGYALGDIYGSQIYHTMSKEIEYEGEFLPIKNWLTTNVFSKESILNPMEFIEHITGDRVNTKYHKDYLTNKYTNL